MTVISLIAALDEKGGIGFNNQLLTHLPADLKYFKTATMGKPIIMGRRTYESIGKPLPGRQNIIISQTMTELSGVLVFSDLNLAIEHTKNEPEIMIIGGAQLFAIASALANRMYLTKIHHEFRADVFFPTIDLTSWICIEQKEHVKDEKNPYDLTFYIYERLRS